MHTAPTHLSKRCNWPITTYFQCFTRVDGCSQNFGRALSLCWSGQPLRVLYRLLPAFDLRSQARNGLLGFLAVIEIAHLERILVAVEEQAIVGVEQRHLPAVRRQHRAAVRTLGRRMPFDEDMILAPGFAVQHRDQTL